MSGSNRFHTPPDRSKRAWLFILSAPSGAGKTTLCQAALQRVPGLGYSVSYTTRNPRSGEIDGRHYHFIGKEEFESGIACGKWAEWAVVYDNYYGTDAGFIQTQLNNGTDVLLDIDVQGTVQILNRFADAVTIFVLPPSLEALRRRLEARRTDSREEIERRLSAAEREMAKKDLYRHVIVNDRLETAIDSLVQIIHRYRAGGGT